MPGHGIGPWGENPWGDLPQLENGSFETAGECGLAANWNYYAVASIEHLAGWDNGVNCLNSVESFEGGWSSNEGYVFAFLVSHLSAGTWNYQNAGFGGAGPAPTVILGLSTATVESFEQGWPAPVSYAPNVYGDPNASTGNEVFAFDFASVSSTAATWNYQVGVATPIVGTSATTVESFEQAWPSNQTFLFSFSGGDIQRALWNAASDDFESFEEGWNADTYHLDLASAGSAQAQFCGQSIKSTWFLSDASAGWAVGENGAILYWDGTAWSSYAVTGVTSTLYGVWGSGPADVWACGANGVIIHWDGTTWTQLETPTTNTLYAVTGATDVTTVVWFVGSMGTIIQWNTATSTMTTQVSGTAQALYAASAFSVLDVWAVGNGGVATHYNGTVWTASSTGVSTPLNGVYAASGSQVQAVGNSGVIRFYNGSVWSAQSLPGGATTALYAIHGRATNDVFAVGAGGNIYRWQGASWAAFTGPVNTQALRGVWVRPSATLLWVVGDQGVSFEYNGSSWSLLNDAKSVSRKIETFDILWDSEIGNLA
jgi:hypothetical protein